MSDGAVSDYGNRKTKHVFIFKGSLLEGQIREGMIVQVPLSQASMLVTDNITQITLIDGLYTIEMSCDDPDEVEVLDVFLLIGETIRICEP